MGRADGGSDPRAASIPNATASTYPWSGEEDPTESDTLPNWEETKVKAWSATWARRRPSPRLRSAADLDDTSDTREPPLS